ncbi:MAG: ABC transporter permease [Acidimicrobiaceae bacterium]|nr:ABC transporter permease [Acidimicrobiaceae bacterium]MYB28400.1 ABC transporter permease [Acidimicrobiaceae bacterium]
MNEAAVKPQAGNLTRSWWSWGSFNNIGALYVWALIIAIFWFLEPDTFGTTDTVTDVLNQSAVTGLVALALVVPMAVGCFDLSIGATLGVTSVLTAKLLAETSASPTTAVIVALLVGLAIGLVNAVVVVVFKIDPFIGTLATSSLLAALSLFISGNRTIASERLIGSFTEIARYKILGVTAPVWYMLVVAVILWYLLEHTATGRHIYAIGFSLETARLSGINTQRIRFMSLVLSAFVSGLAGVVLTARITVGSPTIGPPFLLPAFAAVFVGATQLRGGRFNVWGTLIAVYLIGTGNTGLSLAGAPLWAPQVFVGITLIVAIALTGVKRSVK